MSITFTPGVWGLLGANGAGKTTLMRMAALKGLSRAEAARKIDALLEQVSLTEVRKRRSSSCPAVSAISVWSDSFSG